jgi:hypothetical protein
MSWWPWRKPKTEARATGGYSALMTLARAETITGARGLAELTATVQTCVSLWEGALALADVEGTDMLPPATLALCARALALRGEFVALLDGDRLTPAADWDVSTSLSRPRAYRLSLPDVGGGRTVTVLAPEVVHVVIGADVRSPWRGSSPLQRASLTADMLSTLESALGEVFANAPLGSAVVPLPEMPEADSARLTASFRGSRGRVLIRESANVTAAGGPAPATDWRTQPLSPELRDAMVIEAWGEAKAAICTAFGVDPSFLSMTANGGGLREAQRHLALWVLSPIAALIAAELTEKTGAAVRLDVVRPLQAFDAGGRARAFGAMVKALAEAKAAGLAEGEIAALLRLVDWQGATEG